MNRSFRVALAAIALAGVIPSVIVGRTQFIQFDGWWHIFTAMQDDWQSLASEWRADAHPPLYFLLLHFVDAAGTFESAVPGHHHRGGGAFGVRDGRRGLEVVPASGSCAAAGRGLLAVDRHDRHESGGALVFLGAAVRNPGV